MLKKICLSLLPLAAVAMAASAQADTFLGSMGGRSFYLTSGSGFALDQEAYANSLGGSLASIHSQTEQDFLFAATANAGFVWIGFTDRASEGAFVWMDGTAVDYTFWNGGEPNDAGGEDYTVINWNGSTGQWNDLASTSYQRQAIYTLSNVPGPTAIAPFALGALATLRRRRKSK